MFNKISKLLKIFSSENVSEFNDSLIEIRKSYYVPKNIIERMITINLVEQMGSSLLHYYDSDRLDEITHNDDGDAASSVVMSIKKTIVIDGSSFEAIFKAEFKLHEHIELGIYNSIKHGNSIDIYFMCLDISCLRHVPTDTVLLSDYRIISHRNAGKGVKYSYNPAYFSYLMEAWASIYNGLSENDRTKGITDLIPDTPALDLDDVTLAVGNLIAMLINAEHISFNHNTLYFDYEHVVDDSNDSLRSVEPELFKDDAFIEHAKCVFDANVVDKVVNYQKLVGKL